MLSRRIRRIGRVSVIDLLGWSVCTYFALVGDFLLGQSFWDSERHNWDTITTLEGRAYCISFGTGKC